jgi:Homeodomain-like domain
VVWRFGRHRGPPSKWFFPVPIVTQRDLLSIMRNAQGVRALLVRLVRQEGMTVTLACHILKISRPTAYRWLHRYDADPEALMTVPAGHTLSRKPCPRASEHTLSSYMLLLASIPVACFDVSLKFQ